METFSKCFSPSNVYCCLLALIWWYQRKLASSHCLWWLFAGAYARTTCAWVSNYSFHVFYFSLDGTMAFFPPFNFFALKMREKKCVFPFRSCIWFFRHSPMPHIDCIGFVVIYIYILIEHWLFACSSTHFGIYTCITL